MHHVLYEWSELVEIDKHVTQLEKGIEAINQAIKSCNLTENKDYTEPLYRVRSEGISSHLREWRDSLLLNVRII